MLWGAKLVSLEPGTTSWGWELQENVVMDGNKAEHLIDAVGVLSEMADIVGISSFVICTIAKPMRMMRRLRLLSDIAASP